LLTNRDSDSVFFLEKMVITNIYPAASNDYQNFVLYKDSDGNDVLDPTDEILASTGITVSNVFTVVFSPAVSFTGKTNRLWGTAGINFNASTTNYVGLKIVDSSENLVFSDGYPDDYDQLPDVRYGGSELPTIDQVALIIDYAAQPEDFVLIEAPDYSAYPIAFTTNREVMFASFKIFMDQEAEHFTNHAFTQAAIAISGPCTDDVGIVSLYRETDTTNEFSDGDAGVHQTNFSGPGVIDLNFYETNISVNGSSPDIFYLTVKVTNDVDFMLTNRLMFQVTNLVCNGPNGGVFTNLPLLTAAASHQARLDNFNVHVVYISNLIVDPAPMQGSFDNIFFEFAFQNTDIDGTNWLSSLDVVTNNLSTMIAESNHVPYVKLYDMSGTRQAFSFFDGGSRLTLNDPLVMTGTDVTKLFMKYDITANNSVVSSNIGFEITNGSLQFVDMIDDNHDPVVLLTGQTSGPAEMTNVYVKPFNYQYWDFMISGAQNISPVSAFVNEITPLAYFDLQADKQAPVLERLTNCRVLVTGDTNELGGVVYLYRESVSNAVFSTNDTLLASNYFFPGNSLVELNFNINMLNTSASFPAYSRFWLAVLITNQEAAVYQNKIGLNFASLSGDGPDAVSTNAFGGAVFEDYQLLSNISSGNYVQIDTHLLQANIIYNSPMEVEQATFDFRAFDLTIVSPDENATNYLAGLTVTNHGSASTNDLDYFRIYRLNPGSTNVYLSNKILNAVYTGSNVWTLTAVPSIPLSGLTNRFAGTLDVKSAASADTRIRLGLITNSIIFSDQYSEGDGVVSFNIDQRGDITNTDVYERASSEIKIILAGGDPTYDFSLESISYDDYPEHFTTNMEIPAATIKLFKDIDSNPLVFKGIAGQATAIPATTTTDINGILYLYREVSNGGFSEADDFLVGSNTYTGEGSFYLTNLNLDDLTINYYQPDIFYLTFKLVGAIAPMNRNTLGLWVTNLITEKVTNGITNTGSVTNLGRLTSAPAPSRIDSYGVRVTMVSNLATNRYVELASADNPCMQLRFQADDPDAVNYITSITIETNTNSTISNNHISYVFLFEDDGDHQFNRIDDSRIGAFSLSAGQTLIAPSAPLIINGTNAKSYFITYNITRNDPSAYLRRLSFKIKSNSLVTAGSTAIKGSYNGPSPGFEQIIVNQNSEAWDFYISDSENKIPDSVQIGRIYPTASVDIVADGQLTEMEQITRFDLNVHGTNSGLAGLVYVYQETSGVNSLDIGADTLLLSNFVDFDSSSLLIPSGITNLSTLDYAPSRLWVALQITNTDDSHWDESIGLTISNILCEGPGPDGLATNGTLINEIIFTNQDMSIARIDDHRIYLICTNMLTSIVKQGANKKVALSLFFSNSDPDAIYLLSNIIITNAGTAQPTDVKNIYLYQDDGDGVFDNFVDPNKEFSTVTSSNTAVLTVDSGVPFSSSMSNWFWIIYDVDWNATLNRTNTFLIPDLPEAVLFGDAVVDDYNQVPTLISSLPLPAVPGAARIIDKGTSQWDFNLERIDYDDFPTAFSTNQNVVAGKFLLVKDSSSNDQVFNGIDVVVSNGSAGLFGLASLYRETVNAGFSSGDDVSVGSRWITNGSDFSISCAISNVSIDDGDLFYLVVNFTNDIVPVWESNVSFVISKVNAAGTTETPVANTNLLETVRPGLARLDSFRVKVLYVSNSITRYKPTQSSLNNPYLEVGLQGLDPDAVHHLKYIDVATNILSTNFSRYAVPTVRIYTNINTNVVPGICDPASSVGTAGFSEGTNRVSLNYPLRLPGTNRLVCYIGFDAGETSNAIGNVFGLEVPVTPVDTGNVIGFEDEIDDDFPQISYILPANGPQNPTNVFLEEYGVEEWDIYIVDYITNCPDQALSNQEISIGVIETYRENQKKYDTNEWEYIDSILITNRLVNGHFRGIMRCYYGNALTEKYQDAGLIGQSFIDSTNQFTLLDLTNAAGEPYLFISSNVNLPDRLFLTYQPLGFEFDAVNEFSIQQLNIGGYNDGIIGNSNALSINSTVKMTWPYIAINTVDVSPTMATQNVKYHPMFQFSFSPQDPDADFLLNAMVFSITGDIEADEVPEGNLFRESGDTPGFDEADINLGLGSFVNNDMYLILGTPEWINALSPDYYFTVNVDKPVVEGHIFQVHFAHDRQSSAFKPIAGTNARIFDFGTNSTGDVSLYIGIDYSDEAFVVANTIIDPNEGPEGENGRAIVYLAPEEEPGDYRVHVFSLLGHRLRTLSFSGTHQVSWDGRNETDEVVPSGMYLLIIEGSKLKRSTKVLVKPLR